MVKAKVKKGKKQFYKAHLLYMKQNCLKVDCDKLKLYVRTEVTTKIIEQRIL